MPHMAQMNPLRMCVAGVTIYSSNHRLCSSSVKVTPPSARGAKNASKAVAAESEYFRNPVSRWARSKSEMLCPWARAEYQGALSTLRYSQSKWWFQTRIPEEFASRWEYSQSAAAKNFFF